MRMRLKRRIEKVLPLYAVLPLIFAGVFNNLIYFGARMIAGEWPHHIIGGRFEDSLPVIPAFVVIYFGCYLFWIFNYGLVGRLRRDHFFRFAAADFVSRLICLIFFLLWPTTNIRPSLTGDDLFTQGLLWLYSADAADNLFPSIHCLVSWFCYIGIRGKLTIPRWYRVSSCVMAILVFLSTLFTKQHVLIDVAGGILLAELTFFAAGKWRWGSWYERCFDRISRAVWGETWQSVGEDLKTGR